ARGVPLSNTVGLWWSSGEDGAGTSPPMRKRMNGAPEIVSGAAAANLYLMKPRCGAPNVLGWDQMCDIRPISMPMEDFRANLCGYLINLFQPARRFRDTRECLPPQFADFL